jgi:hypothetical protein
MTRSWVVKCMIDLGWERRCWFSSPRGADRLIRRH